MSIDADVADAYLSSDEHQSAVRALGALLAAYQAGDEDGLIEILTVTNLGALSVYLLGMVAELAPRVDEQLLPRLIGAAGESPPA